MAATAAGGEVDALDPGAYGSFTITQAITIEGQGWSYVAPPLNGAAITINAVSGNVNIHGVSLNGVGVVNADGINFTSGGSLNVRDSVIRNFTQDGIVFEPNSSAQSQLFVSNTVVSNNGINGIFITSAGSGTTKGVLDHVQMDNNGGDGLLVSTTTQAINVTVSDSVSANNGSSGIVANSLGATSIAIMVRNCTITYNGGNGLQAQGTSANVRATRTTITGNGVGWISTLGGVVWTFGDNDIFGNAAINNPPVSISHE